MPGNVQIDGAVREIEKRFVSHVNRPRRPYSLLTLELIKYILYLNCETRATSIQCYFKDPLSSCIAVSLIHCLCPFVVLLQQLTITYVYHCLKELLQ